MTKFVFGGPVADIKYMDPNHGNLVTESCGAEVEYTFDKISDSIELRIETQYFQKEDIDELIEFLKAAKEAL
jgi:hypothetical protein